PAVGSHYLMCAYAGIPCDQVAQREIQRTVGSGVQGRRHPFLILELAFLQPVSGSAMRNDIRLADNPRRRHAERLENAVGQYVTVEAARHFADDDAEQQVTGVAVVPVRSRRKLERQLECEAGELVFGVVLSIVERADGVV